MLCRVSAQYPVSTDPQDRVFGGSSFGGIAALAAGMRGAEKCGFGALIVESPSLWIGDPEPETFLKVRATVLCIV
jgi:enterochelin esterase-like enzyme